ncbi:EthD family reductase [Caldimonas tepidiphila]|uniref:EthD family reductase n=1 Tax=Caldimonas tepidiphila TaxID=2315841 RepID=UPI000E5B854B|nr:EthD family reductase [Caldimonas tepidiphila]
MHAMVVLYPQPDDPQAFRDYYVSKHVPLAAQLPGLVSYRYGFPSPLGPAGGDTHFCIFEALFESAEAMAAALKSPLGREVAADVPNYSPKGASLMHYEVAGQ